MVPWKKSEKARAMIGMRGLDLASIKVVGLSILRCLMRLRIWSLFR